MFDIISYRTGKTLVMHRGFLVEIPEPIRIINDKLPVIINDEWILVDITELFTVPRISLHNELMAIVKSAKNLIENCKNNPDSHHTVCSCLSDKYKLWIDDSFPTWLSILVSGVMKDEI